VCILLKSGTEINTKLYSSEIRILQDALKTFGANKRISWSYNSNNYALRVSEIAGIFYKGERVKSMHFWG
jgi:hypothetical protein